MHSNELNTPSDSNQDSPSMHQILQSIREVISGIKDDVHAQTESATAPIKNESASPIKSSGSSQPAVHSPSFSRSSNASAHPSFKNKPSDTTTDVLELTQIVDDRTSKPYSSSSPRPLSSETPTTSTPNRHQPTGELSVLDQIDKAFGQLHTPTQPTANPSAAPAFLLDDEENDPEESESSLSPGNENSSSSLLSSSARESSQAVLRQLLKSLPGLPSQPSSDVDIETLMVRTIEPHLVRWMDEHLQHIVEKIVEKEIKQLILQSRT